MRRVYDVIAVAGAIAGTLALASATTARATIPEQMYETVVPGYYLSSGRGVALDGTGNAYVMARYITQNQNDIVFLRVDPDGSVAWTTEIEGADHDYASDITVGPDGDVYVVGWTDSEDFPLVDPMQGTLTGFRDAFVMRLAAEDGSILYSTLLGGNYTDMGEAIAFTPSGTIVVAGSTRSIDFPVVDAYQSEFGAPAAYGRPDGFVTEISADGSTILYSTFLGGSDDDAIQSVAIAPDGGIVVAGETQSSDFPIAGAFQDANAGGYSDLFVAKLTADGSALAFGSYLGGEDTDRAANMTLGPDGDLYVAAITQSVQFPTTPGAFQETFVGAINGCSIPFGGQFNCEDAAVVRIAADGSALVYATYLGGSLVDECRDLAVDSAGRARIVGYTGSDDFPGGGAASASIFVSQLTADGSGLDYTYFTPSGSANAGHGIAITDAGHTVYTGAINVPADIFVSQLSGQAIVAVPNGDVTPDVAPFLALRNPVRGSSTVRYVLESPGEVSLLLYDSQGRAVRELVDGFQAAGSRSVELDMSGDGGRRLAAGVYFLRLTANDRQTVRRVVSVR